MSECYEDYLMGKKMVRENQPHHSEGTIIVNKKNAPRSILTNDNFNSMNSAWLNYQMGKVEIFSFNPGKPYDYHNCYFIVTKNIRVWKMVL